MSKGSIYEAGDSPHHTGNLQVPRTSQPSDLRVKFCCFTIPGEGLLLQQSRQAVLACDLITLLPLISPVQRGAVIFLPQPPGAGVTSVSQQAGLHLCPHAGLLSFSPEHFPFSVYMDMNMHVLCVYGHAHACVGVMGCTGVCGYMWGVQECRGNTHGGQRTICGSRCSPPRWGLSS